MSPVSSGSERFSPAVLPRRSGWRSSAHAAAGELRDDLVGAVVGASEMTTISRRSGGIVERQRVLELRADHVGLVVGRDHEAHRRRDVAPGARGARRAPRRAAAAAADSPRRRRPARATDTSSSVSMAYGMFLTTCGPSAVATGTGSRCHARMARSNFGFFGLRFGGGAPAGVPVLPDQFERLGAPLALEVKRALVRASSGRSRTRAKPRSTANFSMCQ